jgi:3-oxoadipate enol-lactonase
MTSGAAPALAGTFTTSDGIVIAFTRRPAPRPDSPRLVLIHSLALDQTVWDDVAARLAADVDLLTYDCRGHGRSTRRAGPFTADLFATDLAALLDHVGWASAAVAGCSMGGCVALAFAAHEPGRAERLGLIDTTAWYGEGAAARFAERAAEARAHGMAGLIDFQLTRWFSDDYRGGGHAGLDRAVQVFLDNDVECYAATTALLGAVDLRSVLPQIRVPVAIVVGEEDYATPIAMSRALHEAIPGSTLKILSHGRHLTPIENDDLIAAELMALLARR